jgi:hypothetical protein
VPVTAFTQSSASSCKDDDVGSGVAGVTGELRATTDSEEASQRPQAAGLAGALGHHAP